MSFADNVKRLREAKNYSQAELAELVGVSQVTICNYENGRKKPKNIVIAAKLAEKLDTTVEELVNGGGD